MSKITADWLWSELMDYCRARGVPPVVMGPLFAIVTRARAIEAAEDSPTELQFSKYAAFDAASEQADAEMTAWHRFSPQTGQRNR